MRNSRYKLRGIMLITTVVAVAAWILLAGGIFLTQSSQFQMLGARKIEEQARQYAEVDAQVLKYVAYDKLTDTNTLKSYKLHLKRAKLETVDVADWEDEITIGPEKKSSDNSGGYRVATINIYRKGDTKPRWSMDAILVKGAKNSSESNTGEDPSDSDETKYVAYGIPALYIWFYEAERYPEYVIYIYDSETHDFINAIICSVPLDASLYVTSHFEPVSALSTNALNVSNFKYLYQNQSHLVINTIKETLLKNKYYLTSDTKNKRNTTFTPVFSCYTIVSQRYPRLSNISDGFYRLSYYIIGANGRTVEERDNITIEGYIWDTGFPSISFWKNLVNK